MRKRNQESGIRVQASGVSRLRVSVCVRGNSLLLLFFILQVSAFRLCSAAWSTNAWPAYAHIRAGASNIQELYNATAERYQSGSNFFKYAIGAPSPAPTAPTWYRLNRSLLVNYKSATKRMLDLDKNGAPAYYWVDVVTHSNGLAGVGTNSITKLLPVRLAEICRIPTNYLDYTPWRCLGGAGPFTNDTTVGHGHGWTNATTAAGGTNFPAGRSTWYTTDYGYEGMRLILNQMVAYWREPGAYLSWIRPDARNDYVEAWGSITGTGATYSAAASDFESRWNDGWVTQTVGNTWLSVYKIFLRSEEQDGVWYLDAYEHTESSWSEPFRVRFHANLLNHMSALAATTTLDRADMYAYWWGTNVFNFAAGQAQDGTNFVFWESLPASATETNLYSSNFFGTVTAPAASWSGWITNAVYKQGCLLWFDFNYKD